MIELFETRDTRGMYKGRKRDVWGGEGDKAIVFFVCIAMCVCEDWVYMRIEDNGLHGGMG